MRRIALAVTASLVGGLVLVTVVFPVTAASAAPSPAPVPSAVPGQVVCEVDSQLAGITGLATTANGYAVVVKQESGMTQRVYLLDGECKRSSKSLIYSGQGPNNPQDIQITRDGTFWVADTGDSLSSPARKSIGVWKFPGDGKSVLFRFTYPDGPRAAQAMLISGDGNPIFIADSTKGSAGIYVPDAPPDPSGKSVPLKHAGDFTPQQTGTANTLGKIGQSRVSGATSSPDGKRIAIRTYSDVYEWTVTNGDLVAAITTGVPRITPLPGEPLGEAISYSRDGATFLTVSDVINKQSSTPIQILKYTPTTPAAAVAAKPGAGSAALPGKEDTRDWFGKLGLQEILNIIIAVGVIGVLMVVLGILGIRRSRGQKPTDPVRGRGATAYGDEYAAPVDQRTAARARAADRRQARVPEQRYDTDGYNRDDYPAAEAREPQQYGSGRYSGGGDYSREPEPQYGGDYAHPNAPDRYDAYDPYDAPPHSAAAPPIPAPRSGGVARSHRTGRRGLRDGGDSGGRRGGYAEEHEGFGDMLG